MAEVPISVVIPVYNRADVIPRAINSVLQQTYENFELIIVDDASTDNLEDVVGRYHDSRVSYICHETNRGGSAARNTGIDHASGKYIAFLDSDDEWKSKKLEKQFAEIESRPPEWIAAYCGFDEERQGITSTIRELLYQRLFTEAGQHYCREGGEELIPDILMMQARVGGASTLFVDSTAIERIDGFDESMQRHQDWEFLIRLLRQGKMAYVDEKLVTKHRYDSPSLESVIDGKNKFLKKFSDEIREVEARGTNIKRPHDKHLMKTFARNGDFSQSYKYYKKLNPLRTKEYIGLMESVSKGIYQRIRTL